MFILIKAAQQQIISDMSMGHEHQGKYLLDGEKLTIAAGVGCCPGGSQFVLSFSAWRPLNITINKSTSK